MMKILAISDLHGFLPEIPPCDLLLLGGDYCPSRNLDQEKRFLEGRFSEWLKGIKARYIVGVGGNHDFALQHDIKLARSLPWIYLEDELIDLEGVKIYGTPWTPRFWEWAFMLSESELAVKFEQIPEKLDILLSHGPAYRHLDKNQEGLHCGSYSLWEAVKRTEPDSMVFGHIHESHGIIQDGHTRFYNVSYLNDRYIPKHGPISIALRLE